MDNKGAMSCSFTGHRNIPKEHRKKLSELILRAIDYAYREGCRKFYTGGAVGFDTEVAKALINFRISHPDISFVLVLPCKNQSDFWNDAERDMYEFTLSVADEAVYVSEEYTKTCMKERNSYLAECCDILIAYVSHDRSGASQTKRLAESLGRRVYNLYNGLGE